MIGSEYASSSNQIMMFTAANGTIAAVAFDNGDGNWQDEVDAALVGALCVATVGGIILTEGAIAPMAGPVAVLSCSQFLRDIGFLAYEYHQQQVNNTYTTAYSFPMMSNDNTYIITYIYDTGYYTTTYNPDTGVTGEFVWHWKTGAN